MTRDEDLNGPLSSALHDAGLTVVHEPVVARGVLNDAGDELRRLTRDDWLVLTSVYAIDAVALDAARIPCVAVIGEASESAAKALGLRVELVSSEGDARTLFDALRTRVTQGTVCYPRSSLVAPPDPWGGVTVISPVLYETVARNFDHSVIDRVDIVCVTSPSVVDAIRTAGVQLDQLRFASIGPTTSAKLRQYEIEPRLEAAHRSFASLAQAIAGRV